MCIKIDQKHIIDVYNILSYKQEFVTSYFDPKFLHW